MVSRPRETAASAAAGERRGGFPERGLCAVGVALLPGPREAGSIFDSLPPSAKSRVPADIYDKFFFAAGKALPHLALNVTL